MMKFDPISFKDTCCIDQSYVSIFCHKLVHRHNLLKYVKLLKQFGVTLYGNVCTESHWPRASILTMASRGVFRDSIHVGYSIS
jgi:hypothetical protein